MVNDDIVSQIVCSPASAPKRVARCRSDRGAQHESPALGDARSFGRLAGAWLRLVHGCAECRKAGAGKRRIESAEKSSVAYPRLGDMMGCICNDRGDVLPAWLPAAFVQPGGRPGVPRG